MLGKGECIEVDKKCINFSYKIHKARDLMESMVTIVNNNKS